MSKDKTTKDLEETQIAKTSKAAEKKTRKKGFSITLEDGTLIDLDSYDWGKIKTMTQKLFIFWYTYPGSNAYHNATRAARMAGYTEKTAHKKSYSFLKNEEIARIINQFDGSYIKTTVHDAYMRLMSRKLVRAEFDAADFYKFEQIEDKEGNTHTRVSIKQLNELTHEQRICIDGIEYSGQRSIPNYKLPNRKQEEDEIIRLYEMQNNIGGDNDEFNIETTTEIIKDKLSVQTKIINSNRRMAQKAKNFRKASGELPEED